MKTWVRILCVLAGSVVVANAEEGPIRVMDPWSRAMPVVSKTGAAYMMIVNQGEALDRLIAVESPIAARAELHTTAMTDGIIKMSRLNSIELEPGKHAMLKPGGAHVMLMGLEEALEPGKVFSMTLRFDIADPMVIQVTVREDGPAASGGAVHGGASHDHGASGDKKGD